MKKLIVATAAGSSGSRARNAETLTAFDLLSRVPRAIVVGIVFALMLVGFWQTAIAAAPSQFESEGITVSWADLNIHSKAGAKVLYSRLQSASAAVCDVDRDHLVQAKGRVDAKYGNTDCSACTGSSRAADSAG